MKRLIIGLALVAPSPALAETINLVCLGAGSANRASQTFGTLGGDSVNIIGRRTVPFDDQVNIELVDGKTGRIRLPRAMLPTIRGGKDGWFELSKVQMKEDEITATANVSILNSPKVRLDRLQGHISISGKSGDYAGTCQPYDPGAVTRKF